MSTTRPKHERLHFMRREDRLIKDYSFNSVIMRLVKVLNYGFYYYRMLLTNRKNEMKNVEELMLIGIKISLNATFKALRTDRQTDKVSYVISSPIIKTL